MGELRINEHVVSQHAGDIKKECYSFEPEVLPARDDQSTIAANAAGMVAFESSQNIFSLHGTHLTADEDNIHSINVKFKEYDEMISSLLQLGQ